MKICAIVLNYRDALRTKACLSSLVGQGLDTVLVVDNSADTVAACELAAMVEQLNEQVDYTLHQLDPGSNLGFSRGINLALRDAGALQCDAFLLINNDAVASQGMVAKLAAALATHKLLMVAPTVVDAEGLPQPMLWYQRFFGLLTKRQLPGSFPYLSGCCMLVSHQILKDGRLFDEDFFMYGEDTLLGWRLVRSGEGPLCLGDTFVRHYGAGSSRRGRIFYEYHTARAHILLARKTLLHPLELPLALTCKILGLSLRALWRSLRFGNIVPLRAFFLAWQGRDIRVP